MHGKTLATKTLYEKYTMIREMFMKGRTLHAPDPGRPLQNLSTFAFECV